LHCGFNSTDAPEYLCVTITPGKLHPDRLGLKAEFLRVEDDRWKLRPISNRFSRLVDRQLLRVGRPPTFTVAKLAESQWLSATWLSDKMPQMVVLSARVAAIISAGYAHATGSAGLATRRNGDAQSIQNCKNILAVQRGKRDAPGWQVKQGC
jgi:hypothetical protein